MLESVEPFSTISPFFAFACTRVYDSAGIRKLGGATIQIEGFDPN